MQTVHNAKSLRSTMAQWRSRDERIGFVPTMGNLHDGHLRLVEHALQLTDRVVVSIFVNPMQFGPGEDFERYPRTIEQDGARLAEIGAHLVFAPEVGDLYPNGWDSSTRIEVPDLSNILCGASRPGHFSGVATVVAKLFNLVMPHAAVFGEKDYQQLLVIKRLVKDLCMPIDIVGFPTVREEDGLAMSSRNGYLTEEQRQQAPQLYQALQAVADALRCGDNNYPALVGGASQRLQEAGFEPDYVSIRRAADLREPGPADKELIVLAAARLGRARLIDNLPVSLMATA